MKNTNRAIITTIAFLLLTPAVARAWGASGHNAIVAIAEANLTPKARETIEKYLGGRSIVYYALWMDNVRRTPEHKQSGTWHSAEVDDKNRYSDALTREGGDVISTTEKFISELRDYKKLPDATVALHTQFLVHMLADMHCPVHVKYTTFDVNFTITVNGNETKFHGFWDATIVDTHKWGYQDWVHQMNRLGKEQIAEVTAGTPRDWFNQSAQDCLVIYEWTKPGTEYKGAKYRLFLNKALPLAESQIQKAGYRLAKVLNDCFDPR